MSPGIRRLALALHLVFAVGWIGAALAYLSVGIATEVSASSETIRAGWIALEIIGWCVVTPLSVAALVTGVLMGAGTRWGLFQHYWVVISLALTALSTGVLLSHMPGVSDKADMARQPGAADLAALGGDVFHPAVGILILLTILLLNVYKPKGVTKHGRRVQARRGGK